MPPLRKARSQRQRQRPALASVHLARRGRRGRVAAAPRAAGAGAGARRGVGPCAARHAALRRQAARRAPGRHVLRAAYGAGRGAQRAQRVAVLWRRTLLQRRAPGLGVEDDLAAARGGQALRGNVRFREGLQGGFWGGRPLRTRGSAPAQHRAGSTVEAAGTCQGWSAGHGWDEPAQEGFPSSRCRRGPHPPTHPLQRHLVDRAGHEAGQRVLARHRHPRHSSHLAHLRARPSARSAAGASQWHATQLASA